MRKDPSAISDHIDQNASWLDVDGNGKLDALTDGLLIMRFLSGFRGDALLRNAVANDANRTSANDVESYVFALLP